MTDRIKAEEFHKGLARGYGDYLLAMVCVALGIAVMFALIDLNMLLGDEPYQALCVRNYLESPLGVLVYWIGHKWTDLVGFTILNLRIFTSVELILTAAVVSGYLYYKTLNLRLSAVMFLLTCILFRAGTFYLYNWDTGTYLFDAIALCLLMTVIERPTYGKAVLLGAAIALMTLGRVTSGIFLPMAMVLAYIAGKDDSSINSGETNLNKSWRMAMTVFAGWLITFALTTWAIYGNPLDYFSSFSQDTVVSGHNPMEDSHYLWERMVERLTQLPFCWFVGVVCVLMPVGLLKVKGKLGRAIILVLWTAFCVFLSFWKSRWGLTIFYFKGIDTPLGLGLLFSLPVYVLFHRGYRVATVRKLQLWGCGLIILAIAFGSDAYTERMVTAFSLPVIVSVLWAGLPGAFHRYLKCLVIVSLLSFGTLYATHFVMMQKRSLNELRKTNLPVLSGLRLGEEVTKDMEAVRPVAEALKKEGAEVIYLGNARLFELVYDMKVGMPFHRYHVSLTEKEDWEKYRGFCVPKVEYIVYHSSRAEEEDMPYILEDIKSQGFTHGLTIGDITVLAKTEESIKKLKLLSENL